jgi:hypothetical protein
LSFWAGADTGGSSKWAGIVYIRVDPVPMVKCSFI